MIYCPRCGRLASSTQKFCTGCGLHLLSVLQALAGHPSAEELQALKQRTKTLRDGLQQLFIGIGLALFFYFFFDHSIGFAAIGLMIAFIGLGHILSAMLFASPALRIEWRIPSFPREGERLSLPPEPGEMRTRDLREPSPLVTEPTTLPLDPAKGRKFEGDDPAMRRERS